MKARPKVFHLKEGDCFHFPDHGLELSCLCFLPVIKHRTVFSPKGCDLNINKAGSTKLHSVHNFRHKRGNADYAKHIRLHKKCVLIFTPWHEKSTGLCLSARVFSKPTLGMVQFNSPDGTVTNRGHVGSPHIPSTTQTDMRPVAKSMQACLKMTNVIKAQGEMAVCRCNEKG